jgi:hypothetical protein
MVVATVMAVNAFNGMNTRAWTGWVWFAVSIGVVLVWAYTVSWFDLVDAHSLILDNRLFIH